MDAHGLGIGASLRELLTSLLLFRLEELEAEQLSDELRMRHRMLGLPVPSAPDSDFDDDERLAAQARWVSWLSRDPIELHTQSLRLDETAVALFRRRSRAHQIAGELIQDPIDLHRYELYCKPAWHQRGCLLVKFPELDSTPDLAMTVVPEADRVRLDNLFAVRSEELTHLHPVTPACLRQQTEPTQDKDEQEEHQGAAEYIVDADDFWAGYDDPSPATGTAAQTNPPPGSPGPPIPGLDATVAGSDEERDGAVRDIARGTFAMFRSRHSGSEAQAAQAFISLIRSALPPH